MATTSGFRGVFTFGERRRPEVEEVRRLLLETLMLPIIGLGLVAVALGIWRAVRDGQWLFAAAYFILFGAFVPLTLLRSRPSLAIRSAVLVAALLLLGVGALFRLGLNIISGLLLLSACGHAAVLLGLRAALLSVVGSTAALAAAGCALLSGFLVIPASRMDPTTTTAPLIMTAFTFVAATGGLILAFQALRAKLEESLDQREGHARDLERSNAQLVQEIERRRKAEAALQASELRYRNIFETAAVPILEEDISEARAAVNKLKTEGVSDIRTYLNDHPEFAQRTEELFKVRDANEAAVELYGAKSKEDLLQSLNTPRATGPSEARIEKLAAILEGRTLVEMETVEQTLGGAPVHILLRATIPASDEPWGRALTTTTDITQRKRLESQLAQARKMEAIGTLAGGIAHDFNNILMGIRGCAAVMRIDAAEDDPHRETLKDIEEMVTSGAELTRQLTGLARRGKYDVRATDLNTLARNTTRLFGRARKEVGIHETLPQDLWTVEVDRGQMEQVLLNLYVNAWQAMPHGGHLHLATSNEVLDETRANTLEVKPGKYVVLSVRDTGVGMDSETRERIFEPYFTTKEMSRGTGLGLASAFGIIKNHGGAINVTSEVGKGTTFEVYLPASNRLAVDSRRAIEAIRHGTETILLVDDEQVVLTSCRSLLVRLGYRVLTAGNGSEALKTFEAEKDNIDLVILDMIMPGMGGAEVFDQLTTMHNGVKVLLSSGYSRDSQAAGIMERGCSGFIQKPFTLEELSHALRKILDRPESG